MATCRYGISPQVFNKGKGMIIRILNWCPTLEVREDTKGSTFVVSKLYT